MGFFVLYRRSFFAIDYLNCVGKYGTEVTGTIVFLNMMCELQTSRIKSWNVIIYLHLSTSC